MAQELERILHRPEEPRVGKAGCLEDKSKRLPDPTFVEGVLASEGNNDGAGSIRTCAESGDAAQLGLGPSMPYLPVCHTRPYPAARGATRLIERAMMSRSHYYWMT